MNKFYYNPAKVKTREQFSGCFAAWNQGLIGGLFLPFKLTQFCLGPGHSMKGAHDPGDLCKYAHDCQAKGECASWHTSKS